MSNLSELLPAGAGAKSASFVASGTLGSGVTVALNSDGTVSPVGASIAEALGTPSSEFGSSDSRQGEYSSAYDSVNEKIVVAYRDSTNSNYGTAIVGTVSGSTISFGSPVVYESGSVPEQAVVYDVASGKIVIAYPDADNASQGTAVVGTVSGTSISFGTPVIFETGNTAYIAPIYDANAQKIVLYYTDFSNSNYGTSIVGTVSGTSISFGTPVLFVSGYAIGTAAVYDSTSQKSVLAYRNFSLSSRGESKVGTVSGTSISFGSATVFRGQDTSEFALAYDSNAEKIVLVFNDTQIPIQHAEVAVGTVSGTSISYGSASVFNAFRTNRFALSYDPNSKKVVFAYRNRDASDKGYVKYGEVSGSSITMSSPLLLNDESSSGHSTIYVDNVSKMVITSELSTGVKSVTYQPPYSISNTDFIGITDQAIADTATGAVIVQGGVSDKVTGLTTGSDYYVQTDGSLSTTVSSVPAGRALSSTSILLEG